MVCLQAAQSCKQMEMHKALTQMESIDNELKGILNIEIWAETKTKQLNVRYFLRKEKIHKFYRIFNIKTRFLLFSVIEWTKSLN